jgi:hypothetical protein
VLSALPASGGVPIEVVRDERRIEVTVVPR